jgi:hypothetical protein
MDVQVRGRVLGVEGVHTFGGKGRVLGEVWDWCWAEWTIKGKHYAPKLSYCGIEKRYELEKCGKEDTALSVRSDC